MRLNEEKIKELKEEFPIFKNNNELVYLDNAATTQKPVTVINKIKEFYEEYNANIHRGVYKISEKASEEYEKAHTKIEKLIKSRKGEVIFTRGATESLNLLSHTINTITDKNKKEIVLTELEHHSNLVPWQKTAEQNNWKIKFIKLKNNLTIDYEDVEQKINENTAIVSITHVSNSLGTVNNVKKIVKTAKKMGAITIIDGAQSVPHKEVNVKKIGCDFLVFSGHKMLGPTGIGVLYGKKELLEELEPFNYGGDMISRVTWQEATWNELPWKFEAGTPNIAGGVGLSSAVEYLQKIGLKNVEEWEKKLTKYAHEELNQLKNVEIVSPPLKNKSGIISFNVANAHPHDVATLLDSINVCVRAGHHCTMPLMNKLGLNGTVRASFYFYNTHEDVNTLIKGLKKTKKIFK